MADLKLIADSGGGTVSLKAPAATTSNAAVTLKLPVADGSANQLLKTDGSGQLGWATDSATDSTKMPLAGGTFTGSVDFQGEINFTGNGHKYIDAATLNGGHSFTVRHQDGSSYETGLTLDANGAAKLYYDNSLKLETANAGVTATGILNVHGDSNHSWIYSRPTGSGVYGHFLGTNAAGSASCGMTTWQGQNIYIDSSNNGTIHLRAAGSGDIGFMTNGAWRMTIDDANILLPDSQKINFGAGNDLQIYHNGTNSHITNTTGDLRIQGVDEKWLYIEAKPNENSIVCKDDGAVELYHDNVKKFETVATGVQFAQDFRCTNNAGNNTAALQWYKGGDALYFADSIKAKFGTGEDLEIYHDGSNSYIKDTGTGDLNIAGSIVRLQSSGGDTLCRGVEDGAFELYHDNSLKLETTADGVTINGDSGVTGNWQLETYNGSGSCGNVFAGTGGAYLYIQDTGSGEKIGILANGQASITSYKSGDPMAFSTTDGSGTAERLRIASDGKVHINRTTALDSNYVNFSATKALSAGIPQNQINIGDAAAYNTTDNGGAIGFSAIYSSGGAYTTMASIEGVKTNNTDGNYNGDMVFKTRSHNGNNVTRMRLIDAGLCFGTDTAAANALDDYEYGTFTPTLNNGSVSYEYQQGFYTKVGCLVTVWFDFKVTACSGQSGVPYIGGFPFNKSFNSSNGHYEGVSWWHLDDNFTSSNSCAQGYMGDNSSGMNMYRGNTPEQGSSFVTNQTGRMAGSFSYSAAA